MQDITDLVTNRPLEQDDTKCVHCGSDRTHETNHYYTLVGGDPDPNHHWHTMRCYSCEGVFTRETKLGNVWYTKKVKDEHVLVRGVPSCFENYVYTCAKCAAMSVRRYHTDLDGEARLQSIATTFTKSGCVRHYRIFFKCNSCETKIEVDHGYHNGTVMELADGPPGSVDSVEGFVFAPLQPITKQRREAVDDYGDDVKKKYADTKIDESLFKPLNLERYGDKILPVDDIKLVDDKDS